MSRSNVMLTGVSAALWLTVAGPHQAKADLIQTFDLSGTFQSRSFPTLTTALSGSVTVDVTTGSIRSQTIMPPTTVSGASGGAPIVIPATITQGYAAGAQSYFLGVTNPGATQSEQIFFNVASLVGYAGGSLGSTATPTAGGAVSTYGAVLLPPDIVLVSGSATLEATPVPEPGSAALLALGIAGLTARAFRRRSWRHGWTVRCPEPS